MRTALLRPWTLLYSKLRRSELSRIGVAIDSDFLQRFDDLIASRGYSNRSEAFRDLIRHKLVDQASDAPDSEVVGTLTLVYSHHVRILGHKLTEMQHSHYYICTLIVHLNHDNCLEVLVIMGRASAVKSIADALISTKGTRHGKLTITSTGAAL